MIEYGQEPRLDFDWTQISDSSRQDAQERVTREQAREHLRRIDKAVSWARMNMTSTQAQHARQANKKRRSPDFQPGDLVFVVKKL